MYVNGKIIAVETTPGNGEEGQIRRMKKEVNSSMIYLIYCKNFCKCTIYPQQNNKKDFHN
jgi:hypothetical protein